MQVTVTSPSAQKRKTTFYIFAIGVLLVLLGLVALFSLSGKAVRFDNAYDQGGDLSPYFFSKLEEGQKYSVLQSAWLAVARHRVLHLGQSVR